jgi:hypothetical protein
MKRILIRLTFLVLSACLAAGGVVADECKSVYANTMTPILLGACEFEGVQYGFCLDVPLTGTLNGTWHYYGPPNNWVDVPGVCGSDGPVPMPGFTGFSAGWALDVLELNDGGIRAQDAYMLHWDVYFGGKFAFASISSIDSGTGKYEGASGWFGFVGSELDGGIIRGEICTPN